GNALRGVPEIVKREKPRFCRGFFFSFATNLVVPLLEGGRHEPPMMRLIATGRRQAVLSAGYLSLPGTAWSDAGNVVSARSVARGVRQAVARRTHSARRMVQFASWSGVKRTISNA